MGLINPTGIAEQYRSSRDITTPLVSLILEMKHEIPEDLDTEMKQSKRRLRGKKRRHQEECVANLQMDNNLQMDDRWMIAYRWMIDG